jgi:hypothetical protein
MHSYRLTIAETADNPPLGCTCSAREVDEDGFAGHSDVDVVLSSRCSGIRPAVGMTRTDRGNGAWSATAAPTLLTMTGVTIGFELVYRLIGAR